jgi:hypothetical protein
MEVFVFAARLVNKRYDEAKALITRQNAADPHTLNNFCDYGPDDPEMLQYLLDLGAQASVAALHTAAIANKRRLIRKLIDVGVSVNDSDRFGLSLIDNITLSFGSYNRKTIILVVDAGGKGLKFGESLHVSLIRRTRESLRSCAITMIGVITRRSPLCGERGIRDVTRMIGRAIWESRGIPPDAKE